MFTTGIKEAVLNANHSITISSGELIIDGVGRWAIAPAKMPRFSRVAARTAVNGVYQGAITLSSTLTAGDVVTVAINFATTRRTAEFVQEREYNGKPLVLSVTSSGTTATTLATDIAAALNAQETEAKAAYYYGTATSSTSNVSIPLTSEYVYVDTIEVHGPGGSTLGTVAVTATTAPVVGRGLPKQLEETVKAGSFGNSAPYQPGSDMQINWNTKYDQITFFIIPNEGSIGTSNVINGNPAKLAQFVLYVDELNTFISEWDTATIGTEIVFETAYGSSFGTDEATWLASGGLLKI